MDGVDLSDYFIFSRTAQAGEEYHNTGDLQGRSNSWWRSYRGSEESRLSDGSTGSLWCMTKRVSGLFNLWTYVLRADSFSLEECMDKSRRAMTRPVLIEYPLRII